MGFQSLLRFFLFVVALIASATPSFAKPLDEKVWKITHAGPQTFLFENQKTKATALLLVELAPITSAAAEESILSRDFLSSAKRSRIEALFSPPNEQDIKDGLYHFEYSGSVNASREQIESQWIGVIETDFAVDGKAALISERMWIRNGLSFHFLIGTKAVMTPSSKSHSDIFAEFQSDLGLKSEKNASLLDFIFDEAHAESREALPATHPNAGKNQQHAQAPSSVSPEDCATIGARLHIPSAKLRSGKPKFFPLMDLTACGAGAERAWTEFKSAALSSLQALEAETSVALKKMRCDQLEPQSGNQKAEFSWRYVSSLLAKSAETEAYSECLRAAGTTAIVNVAGRSTYQGAVATYDWIASGRALKTVQTFASYVAEPEKAVTGVFQYVASKVHGFTCLHDSEQTQVICKFLTEAVAKATARAATGGIATVAIVGLRAAGGLEDGLTAARALMHKAPNTASDRVSLRKPESHSESPPGAAKLGREKAMAVAGVETPEALREIVRQNSKLKRAARRHAILKQFPEFEGKSVIGADGKKRPLLDYLLDEIHTIGTGPVYEYSKQEIAARARALAEVKIVDAKGKPFHIPQDDRAALIRLGLLGTPETEIKVMVRRSDGSFTEAIVQSKTADGRNNVQWTMPDGRIATKVVGDSDLKPTFNIGDEVSIPRSDGTRSTGRVISRTDGRAEVAFTDAQGRDARKVVAQENLLPAERTPAVPAPVTRSSFGNGDEVSIPRSDGSRSIATIASQENGTAFVTWTDEQGRTLSKRVPVSELRPASELASVASQQSRVAVQVAPLRAPAPASIFRDQPGFKVPADAEYVSPRSFVTDSNRSIKFQVRSSPEFREIAVRQKRIIEFEPGAPARVEPGTYTYLVTREGNLVLGKLDDSFELGTKHQNLANGREVVTAGELRVLPDGSWNYNLESGTYTRNLESKQGVRRSDLQTRTDQSLNGYFRQSGRYTDEVLAPNRAPSLSRIREACGVRTFLAYNMAQCCEAVGIGCH